MIGSRKGEILCRSCMWAESCQGKKDIDIAIKQVSRHDYIKELEVSFQCTEYVKNNGGEGNNGPIVRFYQL